MDILEGFKKLNYGLLDLVFPVVCLLCGADGQYLCAGCRAKLARQPQQLCCVCQQAAPFGKTHPACASKNKVDGAISALPYGNPQVKQLVEIFKYKFVEDLGPVLAGMIAEQIRAEGLASYLADFELVPIPLHSRRLNWRGFNQAEILGRHLSEILGIKMRADFVSRVRHTRPQVELNARQRRDNLAGAFALNHSPAGKSILLVDDVITSGATANELAKLFKRGQAKEVWIAAAAHG